tara:strand:- start:1111 stop:3921 length:2811 start_codon:yes stop_codon:yes gene_type:complete
MFRRIYLASLIIIPILYSSVLFSQPQESYLHVPPKDVKENEDVQIVILLIKDDPISSGILFFREKGEVSYQEIPMEYNVGSWVGIIPGSRVVEPGIEYLAVLQKMDGGQIGAPSHDNPFDNPLQFIVLGDRGKKLKKKKSPDAGNFVDADILILSPEVGSLNRPDEVVISLSLFSAPNIDQENFHILLDSKDVTESTIIAGDVLSFVPENDLLPGMHNIQIYFKTSFGLDVSPVEWSFNVNKGMVNMSEAFKYKGSINGKNSVSSASGVSLAESELNAKLDAELSWIKARYSIRKSSRESSYIQPLNRNTLILQVADYLKLEYGDIYPSLSPYVLNGKRVRGRHINIDLPYFEVQYVNGELSQGVQYKNKKDGALKIIENDTKTDSSEGILKTIYSLTRTGYTFPRNINATRLSLNAFKSFKAGVHFTRIKDDFGKIRRSVPGTVTFSVDSTLDSINAGDYTYSEFNNLVSSLSDSISIPEKNWDHVTPLENIVFGFDFEKALDNRKLLIQMAWNMSWTNTNIWDGSLTWDEADVLLDSLDNDSLLNIPISDDLPEPADYENIITINPLYMVPLVPIDPVTFQKNKFRAIINMPSAAFNLRVKGSYSFNNLLIEYRQIGPEFRSMGNPYLTNNIREFIFNDRVSTLGRRLMVSVGYKYKDNNLSETVANPLKTKTLLFNTTLVPGPGAVSLIFNLQSISQGNGIDSLITDSYGNILSDNREDSQALNTMASINIPSFGPYSSSTIAFNLNAITYKDNLADEREVDYLFQKSDTRSYSAVISTKFENSLSTSLSSSLTTLYMPLMGKNNIVYKSESSWMSISMTAQYKMDFAFFTFPWYNRLEPNWQRKLRLKGGMDYMTNREKDNNSIKLYGGKIGAEIDLIKNLVFSTNGTIRMNYAKGNVSDGLDNDKNGKIDDKGENLIVNNSGFYITLSYRF